jgi:hypothetical protein
MFDIHQTIHDEDGNWEESKAEAYFNGLIDEFVQSPEGKQLIGSEKRINWTWHMIDLARHHLGATPAAMTTEDFNEVLFGLFPSKVSTEPENAPAIVDELRAFWQFLVRQYGLDNAHQILETLDDDAVLELQKELADPANYGMAKSFFMKGQQAGFDMTTADGCERFRVVYNSMLLSNPAAPRPRNPPDPGVFSILYPISMFSHERAEKRKSKKRQRQARKKNRR